VKRKRYTKQYRPRYTGYAPNLFVPDRYSNQTLKALLVKLSRDYLGFFRSLSELYGASKQKKEIDAVTVEIKKTIALVESVISSGAMNKRDVELLVERTESINAARDYFLEQSKEVTAFRERVEKVTAETGVSLQDLNITEEVVKRGAGQVRRAGREGAVPFLKRTMPGTIRGVTTATKGLGVAAFGPFAPFAGMAGTAMKDIVGLTRGIAGKVRQRRESVLESQLRPMAMGAPPATFERLLGARGGGEPLTGYGGVSRRGGVVARPTKEQMVLPLTYFFDKKAHKAKWTREILNRFKALEKRLSGKGIASMLGLGGLTKKFGMLGAGLLPLIGKVGLIAGLGAATVFTVIQLKKLTKTAGEYWDVLKNVEKHRKKQLGLEEKFREKESAIHAKKMIAGKTPEERAEGRAGLMRIKKEREEVYRKEAGRLSITEPGTAVKKLGSWWLGGAKTILGIGGKPRVDSGAEPMTKGEGASIVRPPSGGPVSAGGGVSATEMKELQKSIDNLSDSIKKDKAPEDIRRASLGNIYDSSDALGNEFASGGVTIGS